MPAPTRDVCSGEGCEDLLTNSQGADLLPKSDFSRSQIRTYSMAQQFHF